MKVSVERLRWWLAAAVVLLLVGLASLLSYGRYKTAKLWKELLAKNGVHISHDSDNVTWSQSKQGHTVFTIRAKKAVPIENGKWKLHGVTLLFYGKKPNEVNQVNGDEFEYDEKQGVARAIGEVHMDIQAPGALTHKAREAQGSGPTAQPAAGGEQQPGIIHVKTSGLVYVRSMGTAATQERTEFRYAGITCVSQGAEFDTDNNALHLLHDVVMTGEMHGKPATLHAAKADLDRDANTIDVAQPVASSGQDAARAEHALLWLHQDGSLQHADATGGVQLQSEGRNVTAQQLQAVFGAQNAPQAATLTGGVTLDGSVAKPMHGTASAADLVFTSTGAIKTVIGKGSVRLASSLPRPGGGPALTREMRGDQITANFRAAGKGVALQNVHAAGHAFTRGESFAGAKANAKPGPGQASQVLSGVTSTQISADDLQAEFAASGAKDRQATLQHLIGRGHARLQQDGLNGAQEDSSAETLEASFAPDQRGAAVSGSTGSVRLVSAVQTGHVDIRNQEATQVGKKGALSLAHGERAAFDSLTDQLVLTGDASYQQEGTSLTANSVSLEQDSGNAEARGNVEATLASNGHDATHVQADRALMNRTAKTAEFFSTDAHPARMWQAGSQVLAAHLFLDNAKQSLTARPLVQGASVQAVFSAAGRGGKGKQEASQKIGKASSGGPGEAVHVSCPTLDYSGLRHEAVCAGGVRMQEGDTQARSQQAVMFLSTPPPTKTPGVPANALAGAGDMGGTLERMVLSGSVRMDAPGGAGDGDQLAYSAKDDTYVLTGTASKPPRVANTEQGMVTGPALVFRRGEKQVIVTGAGTSNGHEAGGRVHTDVVVRPQGK